MKGIFDIHCHILPGVDDGSTNEEMTRAMLKLAWEDGITAMLATPHYHPGHFTESPQRLREAFARACELAAGIHPELQLYLGSELYYRHELPETLAAGQALTLAGSRYVLVEFSPARSYHDIASALLKLRSYGYRPVLAHAERYADLLKHTEYVEELYDKGIYIQVNASSVMGGNGFGVKRFVKRLLKEELVHFIGSDAHDIRRRKPELRSCAAYIEQKCGRDYAQKLCREHALCILNNEAI